MSTTPRTKGFTDAQIRALLWLPKDGAWKRKPGRMSASLNSLKLRHDKLAEFEWGDFGPQGGREIRWRLTDAGVEARKTVNLDQAY